MLNGEEPCVKSLGISSDALTSQHFTWFLIKSHMKYVHRF